MTKYYFVKYNGRWTIARKDIIEYSDKVPCVRWFIPGVLFAKNRYDFDEIGDEILLPEED